jgi:hypothetical protein
VAELSSAEVQSAGNFMSEGKTYFYETEIDWTGAKDLKLSGGGIPWPGGKLVA